MSGAGIMNVLNVSTNRNDSIQAVASKGNKKEFDVSLMTALAPGSNPTNDIAFDTNQNAKVDLTTKTGSQIDYEQYQYKDNSIHEVDQNDLDEMAEEAASQLQEFEQRLMETISEDLNVNMEDIEAMLHEMGFTVMDLLEPKNLVAFVQNLLNVSQAEQLLFQDEFQNLLMDFNQMTKEFVQESGISLEELKSYGLSVEAEQEKSLLSNEDVILENSDDNIMDETVDDGKNSVVTTDEVDSFLKTTSVLGDSDTSNLTGDSNSSSKQFMTESDQMIQFSQNGMVDSKISAIGDFVEQISSYQTVDTQMIFDQIVQRVRVSLAEGVSSIEMQLNPENLGKLFLNISSKDGAIHAQIFANNETVREALELQMVALKEQLNQAGVKVDAIEVSVGTHEFERNLEQGQKREEQEGQYQEQTSGRRRNITIQSLDELMGIMSEEEALVAQMMLDQGNSVDLTA